MKKLILSLVVVFAFATTSVYGQQNDDNKKPGVVYVENGDNATQAGRMYRAGVGIDFATRSYNGNSNDRFGNIGDWSVDLVITEKNAAQAAQDWGGFTDSGHPIYTGGDGSQNMIHNGMGATGWGSFAANAYNRSSGVGSVALGFHTIAGKPDVDQTGITGDNIGQFSVGWSVRATGNRAFASGHRTHAAGSDAVAMGNWSYATGQESIALGKENWAEGANTVALGKENWAQGANTVAIGWKNHAAGGGSTALGQENISWGTTNFTAGYQNVAGDTSQGVGSGGSATAMGKYNVASADASMALNRGTTATNQAATSMGLGTTADNVGMVAVGVNNAAGLGDPTTDQYYYADGQYTGAPIGVAFVVGNGDVNSSNGLAGDNPSNAFVVNYDGSATLSGDLTVNSDMRLKSNIVTLGSTLSKLLLIDGKSYTMKSNEAIEKIGLLAQEVQQAFPELVKQSGDAEGTLSINYQGMIPVLINAINEQQKELQKLKNKLKLR